MLIACDNAESQSNVEGSVADNFPLLSSTPIAYARFAKLPKDVLIRSGNISVKKQELDAEIEEARSNMRKQLQDNAFFILEQKFTEKVILEESKRALTNKGTDISSMQDMQIIQAFIMGMIEEVEPTEKEMADFYEANKDMMGGMPLERVKGQILAFLQQQKQQETVQDYVKNVLTGRQVEISAPWASEYIPKALNNAVDKARASSKPTLANFGSDGCVPCQMMIPAREAVIEKLGDKVNVVYIHVDKDQILASRYGVQSIPTLIFFDKQGNEIHNHVGMMSQEEMEERLNNLLK